jgi:SAP domain-containing new25
MLLILIAHAVGEVVKQKVKLSTSMTLTQFDNGYWYTTELKDFAKTIGIPSANRLRKDELEDCIKLFLKTGKIEFPNKRSFATRSPKDVDVGLSLDLPVAVYTNDNKTKDFLENEVQKIAPGLKRKSGARYRLNRWREAQLANGVRVTYRDLVQEYVRLNQTNGAFAQVPHGRYVNFLSDFLKAENGAKREQAIKAWETLKTIDAPKNYRSWKKFQSRKKK